MVDLELLRAPEDVLVMVVFAAAAGTKVVWKPTIDSLPEAEEEVLPIRRALAELEPLMVVVPVLLVVEADDVALTAIGR